LVRLREGPFADFPGVVPSIGPDGGSMTVVVDIFGRVASLDVPPGPIDMPTGAVADRSEFDTVHLRG
jgi:hypothetical protein